MNQQRLDHYQLYYYTQAQRSNEQSLHAGVVRVILMTASRCEDKQICSISRLSFLSESPTHVIIKPVTVCQSAKLVMQKILVPQSSGDACNMALESPKLSHHLLQSMNNQIDPLVLENLAPFASILSVPVMLI